MKIVRYMAEGANGPAVGIVNDGNEIAEVAGATDLGVLALLDRRGLERVASTAMRRCKIDEVRLLAPVGRPGKILCLAGNYHPTDSKKDIDLDKTTPKFFSKPNTALIGPDDAIVYHKVTTGLIQEIELGVVIGKPGKDIARKNAYDHIFGYTIMNDTSARSLDLPPGREANHYFDWLNGKWLDTYCPAGPWIVEKSDIADPMNLGLVTKVNGEVRIASNTNRMIFDITRQIEYISRLCTLEPGDLIATGVALAHAGASETPLQAGDVVEGDVEDIGTLRNPVIAG